jgi:hypothetical protein
VSTKSLNPVLMQSCCPLHTHTHIQKTYKSCSHDHTYFQNGFGRANWNLTIDEYMKNLPHKLPIHKVSLIKYHIIHYHHHDSVQFHRDTLQHNKTTNS